MAHLNELWANVETDNLWHLYVAVRDAVLVNAESLFNFNMEDHTHNPPGRQPRLLMIADSHHIMCRHFLCWSVPSRCCPKRSTLDPSKRSCFRTL